MSMSYELMMRKKQQIMYATIKGSLTENNGVFSEFSASNYLQLQQNLDSDNLEMVIDFTTGDSIVGGRVVFMNRSVFDLEVYSSGLSSYNWQNNTYNSVIPSTDYSVNTNYKVKIIRSSSTISFAYSKNGGAYISTATFTTTKTVSNPATFGTSPVERSRYFNGSINLNRSYIKIGSTKYNLQAVVGYTVVGSPSIVDGVVSGFSGGNYLQLPSFNPSNNFEMVFKFKFATSSIRNPIIGVNSGGIIRLLTFTNDKLLCSLGTSSANFSIMEMYGTDVLQTDTYYWIKFKFTGEEYIVKYSIDGINYIQQIYKKTSTLINNGNPFVITIGRSGTQGYALNGSINLNETYIKINNKLWFNGQQA